MMANPALADMMKGISKMLGAKDYNSGPTLAELEEYCRDPESSGCSVEMMDLLIAEKEKMKKLAAKDPEYRWSKDIDEAVAKCD